MGPVAGWPLPRQARADLAYYNAEGETVLVLAAVKGHVGILKELLHAKANPDYETSTGPRPPLCLPRPLGPSQRQGTKVGVVRGLEFLVPGEKWSTPRTANALPASVMGVASSGWKQRKGLRGCAPDHPVDDGCPEQPGGLREGAAQGLQCIRCWVWSRPPSPPWSPLPPGRFLMMPRAMLGDAGILRHTVQTKQP